MYVYRRPWDYRPKRYFHLFRKAYEKGDIVGWHRQLTSGTTHTAHVTWNTKAGNLLFVCYGIRNETRTITSRPSSLDIVSEYTADDAAVTHGFGIYYKILQGNEHGTTYDLGLSGTSGGLGTTFEVEWGQGSVDTLVGSVDTSNENGTGTTQTTGSVSPSNLTNNLVIGFLIAEFANEWNGTEDGAGWGTLGQVVTSGTLDATIVIPGIAVDVSGSTSDTYTTDDTGGSSLGFIMALNPEAAGVFVSPLPQRVYRKH